MPIFTVDLTPLSRRLKTLTGNRNALASWLAGFDDPDRAEPVARRSYWHHNGFAKLVLHAADDHRVRLHVWPAGENRLGESNPHGHRWNFASTVIAGDGLSSTEYAETTGGLEYVRYAYVRGGLTAVGHTWLAPNRERVVRRGEDYVLDTTVVHTVLPLGTDVVATLVVQGPAVLESALVYCAPGVAADGPTKDIDADEVRELVRAVLGGLE